MKFKDNVKMDNQQKELVQNIPQKEDKINYENTEMQSQSDELVDKLQADIVNSGSRLLAGFRGENRGLWNYVKPKTDTGTDPVRAAEVSIKELQDFQYTIGFAGGQSAGKSTVVNALLKYPLMPTCQIVTTCTPVELFYGERIRILVSDAYTGKILLDYPCDRATDSDFQKLKEYTCTLSALPQVIENLQPFVKGYIGGYDTGIKPDQLEMQKDNPRHVAILMMILLTVYVKQNLEELTHKQRALNQLRDRTLKYFKIPANVPNIAVHIQWNSSILKSGLKILDLPGLGSNAEDKELDDGSILDGHTKITKKAIVDTKTMVVVQDPFVLGSVWEAVKEMVSNLLAREVVVENCIIPVLNKFDMCNGSAGQQSALSTYISDLKNLGVKKEVKDVFPLSAIYGEYAYEDCPDKSRTMYVQKALQGVTDQDYINDIMYMKPRELKREYEKSGVEELREFFRTTFIERGKLESSLSVVAEIKSLESGIRAEIIAQKKMYEGFVGANENLVGQAIPRLKAIANKPINEAIEQLSSGNISTTISLMTDLTKRVVKDYEDAFKSSADEYYNRNMKIVNSMKLKFKGMGDFAIVDSSKPDNYRLYQQFIKESQRIVVEMKDVNISYAEIMTLIKKDIDQIFDNAVIRLHSFVDTYEPNLKVTIAKYGNGVSEDVIKIFEDIIPIISEFVENQIDIAENGINKAIKEIESTQLEMADLIIAVNDEFVSTVSDYAISHTEVGQTLFRGREKLKIDGENGAKQVLGKVKEIIGNSDEMKSVIQTVCSERIINPMQGWYTSASDSVTDVFIGIQNKIITLLDGIAEQLKDSSCVNGVFIEKMDEDLKQTDEIFSKMKESIRTSITQALPVAREKNIVSQKYEKNMMAWINGGESVGK